MAVFTTKTNDSWTCWLLEGGIGLGFTAGSIKVAPTQINAYFWAWTAVPTDMPNGVSDSQGCGRHSVSAGAIPKVGTHEAGVFESVMLSDHGICPAAAHLQRAVALSSFD